VIGENEDGDFYSPKRTARMLWWLELARKRLMEIGDGDRPIV